MKRQQAFMDHGKTFLKGGLHTHTTRSDGRLTPEETLPLACLAVSAPGGLDAHINARQVVDHIPSEQYPAGSLAAAYIADFGEDQ